MGDSMNIDEAINLLQKKQVICSKQVLRKWLRQGKIEATMKSRTEGYEINRESLERFVFLKQVDQTAESIKGTSGYEAGDKVGRKGA